MRTLDNRDRQIKENVIQIKNNRYDKQLIYNNEYLNHKLQLLLRQRTKICIIVLTCKKYEERLQNLQTKLLDNLNYDYILLKADENIHATYLNDNILTVNVMIVTKIYQKRLF